MSATFYKMTSKIYRIKGKVNPVWIELLDDQPKYAVRVNTSDTHYNTKSLVIITDGEYCYFETYPKEHYELIEPIGIPDRCYWKLMHKEQGPFKLHL